METSAPHNEERTNDEGGQGQNDQRGKSRIAPNEGNDEVPIIIKRKKKRTRSETNKETSAPSYTSDCEPERVRQLIRVSADMTDHPCSTPFFSRTDDGIMKGIEWTRSISPLERFLNPVDLTEMKEFPFYEL